MYKVLIFFFHFIFYLPLHSQEINKIIADSSGKEILIGECNIKAFQMAAFGNDYNFEYDNYIPDPATIDNIFKFKANYNILIVLASWCSDSREQIPRFFRIIDMLSVPHDNIRMICIDKTKNAPGFEEELGKLNIERVPTFIIISSKTEIGRIIETPNESLEIDLMKILEIL